MAIEYFNEAARLARERAGMTPTLAASSDMRDWPESLRLNAAACSLAHALYLHRAEAFELSAPDWSELDAHTRGIYIDQAKHVLLCLR